MYEFHGWIGLADSPEDPDDEILNPLIDDLRRFIADVDWHTTGSVELSYFNGDPFLRMDGVVNRMRDEAREVSAIFEYVAQNFKGAWGLLYERAADMPTPPGPGVFRVRVLARGRIEERLDPFLSPVNPVIED